MITLAIISRFSDVNVESIDTKLHKDAFSGDITGLKETLSSLTIKSVKDLVDKRNHLGCTALRLAATGGHTDCAYFLLSIGASVDIADIKGQTPLFVAVKNNHVECVKVLLEFGANPEGDDGNVSTPLYTVAMNGSNDILKLLIKHGACLSELSRPQRISRSYSNDPLQVAVTYHKYTCCRTLLAAGYEPGSVPVYHVALHYNCDIRLLYMFYEFGINLYTKDQKGKYFWEKTGSSFDRSVSYLIRFKENPRSLLSTCRLATRRLMRNLEEIESLSLPVSLIDYLLYKNILYLL